jgi:hypothetical protein
MMCQSYAAVSVGIKLTLKSSTKLALLMKFSLGTLLQEFELEVGQGLKSGRI